MKYKVKGKAELTIDVVVEANSEDEAIEKAYYNVTLNNYSGKGNGSQLVGVEGTSDTKASIYPDSEIEYDEVELINEDAAKA